MFAEGINVSESWKEALDDGSLTLASEIFLLALPSDQVPVFTCLQAPNLLNLITSLKPNSSPDIETVRHNLTSLATAKANSIYYSVIPHPMVSEEIQRLSSWLDDQIVKTTDSRQAA